MSYIQQVIEPAACDKWSFGQNLSSSLKTSKE